MSQNTKRHRNLLGKLSPILGDWSIGLPKQDRNSAAGFEVGVKSSVQPEYPAQSAQCKATPLGTSQDVCHFLGIKKGWRDLVALQFPTAATNGHFMTSLA